MWLSCLQCMSSCRAGCQIDTLTTDFPSAVPTALGQAIPSNAIFFTVNSDCSLPHCVPHRQCIILCLSITYRQCLAMCLTMPDHVSHGASPCVSPCAAPCAPPCASVYLAVSASPCTSLIQLWSAPAFCLLSAGCMIVRCLLISL